MKGTATTTALDRWAIVISGLCVIHCLAIPLTIVLLPTISGPLAEQQTLTHWLLLAVALPVSALALGAGYRQHGGLGNLVLGAVGLILLTVGVSHWLGEQFEVPCTVAGGLLLIVAHLRNLRHRHAH